MCEKKKREPVGIPPVSVWRQAMESQLLSLEGLILKLPIKGLREEDCQRLCLLNRLSELRALVTGTEQADMENWTEGQAEFLNALVRHYYMGSAGACAREWAQGREYNLSLGAIANFELDVLLENCNMEVRNGVQP